MSAQVKEAPEFLKRSVMYQIFLRPFTPEGTLKAAEAKLPRLAELGIDLLYLCPVVKADDDRSPENWSARQHSCGLDNEKNPYRLMDFFQIDSEYGSAGDFRDFVKAAHALGMKVLPDLVYFHCGPSAVFLKDHPDFVRRDEDGGIKTGDWHFPELNFENPALREYLYENMAWFLREFDVDGFRCDVADAVPLDFWKEARRRLEKLNPALVMLAESGRKEDQIAAFDLNYSFKWYPYEVFSGEYPASRLTINWNATHDSLLPGARVIRYTENHDIANDLGGKRWEAAIGSAAHDAMQVINFTIDGVPFLYNGQEIADKNAHSIWANRDHGPQYRIDWSRAETPEGKRRFALLKELIALRRREKALLEGDVQWLAHDAPDTVAAFLRHKDGDTVLVAVNCRNGKTRVRLPAVAVSPDALPRTLLKHGAFAESVGDTMEIEFEPYGYFVSRY